MGRQLSRWEICFGRIAFKQGGSAEVRNRPFFRACPALTGREDPQGSGGGSGSGAWWRCVMSGNKWVSGDMGSGTVHSICVTMWGFSCLYCRRERASVLSRLVLGHITIERASLIHTACPAAPCARFFDRSVLDLADGCALGRAAGGGRGITFVTI